MPFRHVTMFRWAPHVDTDHVSRVRDAFDELAHVVAGVRHHTHGSDVGFAEGNFDFHVVADFDTVADWRAYRDHPAHVLLVAELISGHVVEQAAGQFQTTGQRSAHEVSSTDVQAAPTDPCEHGEHGADDDTESDDELIARARRAAMAEMQALLAEPDDPM